MSYDLGTISWSPDGKRIALCTEVNGILIYDVSSGNIIRRLEALGAKTSVWLLEGSYIASAGYDQIVRIWDVDNGELIQTLNGHNKTIDTITLVKDKNQIVSAQNDGLILVWDSSE